MSGVRETSERHGAASPLPSPSSKVVGEDLPVHWQWLGADPPGGRLLGPPALSAWVFIGPQRHVHLYAVLGCTHLLVRQNNLLKETPCLISTRPIHTQIPVPLEIRETSAPKSLLFTDEA